MSFVRRASSTECRASIGLSMCVRVSGECVYYKQDGARFAQPQTIKLVADSEYAIKLSANGDSHPRVVGADLGGRKVPLKQVDGHGTLASGTWLADCLRKTKDGIRDELLLTVQIETDGGFKRTAVFPLQVKVYARPSAPNGARAPRRSCSSGDQLGSIGFEMVWDELFPFSPVVHAHDLRFSRRTSSLLLAQVELSKAGGKAAATTRIERSPAASPPTAREIACAA